MIQVHQPINPGLDGTVAYRNWYTNGNLVVDR